MRQGSLFGGAQRASARANVDGGSRGNPGPAGYGVRIEHEDGTVVELKESLKNLERRHVKFEEATSLADSEVRDQLMKHSAAFSAELSRTSERLTTELDRAASALRADKVDTTTLAATLNEMATKLTGGGGRPPNKGTTKS